jgi:ABC-type glycerol-3-phosphate transport system substrate-binding protein
MITNIMPIKLKRRAISLAASALLLAACGGGDGGGETAVVADPLISGTQVPASATTNSASAVAFVKSVAASSDNSASPIAVGDVTLATSDSDEPDAGV